MKKSLLLCLFLVIASALFAQNKPASAPAAGPMLVTTVENVKEYKLANGLQVLLVPDAALTNVVINVVYKVGSRHEGYGETGMAHLLEHMMFKGSKKFLDVKKTIAGKGAFANGTTWYDRTNYYEILPATDSNLNWALEMEADRMVNSLMKDADLQKEFSVVRNEFEMGENDPSNILEERIMSTMYLWHNYGKSTIGSKEDIEKVPIDNLKMFYKKYYQPDNAALVVGGKFDEAQTLALISKYFGAIARPSRSLTAPYTMEPTQDGERFVELRRNGDISYMGMAFHTPSYGDKDFVANEAVGEILSNDPSGIFYKALVETKLATKVSKEILSLYDPGFSYYGCEVPKDKSMDSVKQAFIAIADRLPSISLTQEDLDRAKNILVKRVSDVQNNTLRFCIGLTEIIGAGDWRLFYIYRDRVEQLTLSDLQNALKKYYLPSNRTWGVFIPDKEAENQRVVVNPRPDVEALVKNYKGKAVTAQTQTFEASIDNIRKNTTYGRLPNGFKYAMLKKPVKGDKVYANIIIKFASESSLTGKNIIPMLTARMLKNGTTTKTKKEINDKLAKWKSSIGINGDENTVNVSINSDKDNIDSTMNLLADLLLNPSFDRNEFDKMLLDLKGEIEASKSDPQAVAFNALSKKMSRYPAGHPLYPEGPDEELNDIKKANVDDLRSFYVSFYGANHAVGSFVGNLDEVPLTAFLTKNFGGFNSKEPYKEIEEKYFDIPGGTETITIPDKKNAVLGGSINVPMKETDPDYPAFEIANELLGGGAFMASRIPQRLREKEGMSYGAGSYLNPNFKYAASSWGVYAIFNPMYKNRIDSALNEEISKALQKGFTDEEFKKYLPSWYAQRKTYLGLDNYLAYLLSSYLDRGSELSYYTDKENQVRKLTLAQVNAALKKYIDPAKLNLIYAGDFNKKAF